VKDAAVTVASSKCDKLPAGNSITVNGKTFVKSLIADAAMGGWYTGGYAYNIIHNDLCYRITLQINGQGPGAGANDGQGPLPKDRAPANAKDKFDLIFTEMVKTFDFFSATQEQNQTTETEANGLTCYNNSKYFLIAKDGSNNIVKYKTTSGHKIACDYIIGKNDFKFGNGAEYFLAFEGKFLLTDSGTGPGCRGLTVYDLNTQKEIYKDSYCKPVTTDNDVISYWTPTNIKPNNDNCPKLSEYLHQTGSAEIETHVSLDLNTLIKKDLGESRCSETQ
jgi:hypothetical protein